MTLPSRLVMHVLQLIAPLAGPGSMNMLARAAFARDQNNTSWSQKMRPSTTYNCCMFITPPHKQVLQCLRMYYIHKTYPVLPGIGNALRWPHVKSSSKSSCAFHCGIAARPMWGVHAVLCVVWHHHACSRTAQANADWLLLPPTPPAPVRVHRPSD